MDLLLFKFFICRFSREGILFFAFWTSAICGESSRLTHDGYLSEINIAPLFRKQTKQGGCQESSHMLCKQEIASDGPSIARHSGWKTIFTWKYSLIARRYHGSSNTELPDLLLQREGRVRAWLRCQSLPCTRYRWATQEANPAGWGYRACS